MLGTFPTPPNTQPPYDRDSGPAEIQIDGTGHSADVLRLPAILRIERTAFSSTFTDHLSTGIVMSTKRIGHTDIVRRLCTRRTCHGLNTWMVCAVFMVSCMVGSQGRRSGCTDQGDIPCDGSTYSKGACITSSLLASGSNITTMLTDCSSTQNKNASWSPKRLIYTAKSCGLISMRFPHHARNGTCEQQRRLTDDGDDDDDPTHFEPIPSQD